MALARQQSVSTPAASTEPAQATVAPQAEQQGSGNGFLASMVGSVGAGKGATSEGARTATDFSSVARRVFSRIDTDKDGYLSEAEIDAAMVDRSFRGEDAAVVATLKELRAELEELADDEWGDENSGVTMKDLEQYERSGQVPKELRDRVEATHAYGKGKIAGQSRALVNGAARPDAVQQGSIGDCYFLAAIVGRAYTDPSAIKKMVTDNGNNTYTVSFPGRKPVTVSAPTDAELARYSTAGQNGLWLSIAEKAYGQVRNDEAWFSTTTVAQDKADGGGFLSTGVGAVTGNGTDSDMLSLTSNDTTRAKLKAAMKDKRVVTAGTSKAMPWQQDIQGGVVMGHAYTVVAYDAGSDSITLRNPWGSTEPTKADGTAADGRNDGVFTMKLDAFAKTFSQICYEER